MVSQVKTDLQDPDHGNFDVDRDKNERTMIMPPQTNHSGVGRDASVQDTMQRVVHQFGAVQKECRMIWDGEQDTGWAQTEMESIDGKSKLYLMMDIEDGLGLGLYI